MSNKTNTMTTKNGGKTILRPAQESTSLTSANNNLNNVQPSSVKIMQSLLNGGGNVPALGPKAKPGILKRTKEGQKRMDRIKFNKEKARVGF